MQSDPTLPVALESSELEGVSCQPTLDRSINQVSEDQSMVFSVNSSEVNHLKVKLLGMVNNKRYLHKCGKVKWDRWLCPELPICLDHQLNKLHEPSRSLTRSTSHHNTNQDKTRQSKQFKFPHSLQSIPPSFHMTFSKPVPIGFKVLQYLSSTSASTLIGLFLHTFGFDYF